MRRAKHRGRSGVFRDRRGQQYHYDSRWELWRMEALDRAGVEFRREALRIPYFFEGRRHTYLPDFMVNYWEEGEQRVRIEEVKPSSFNNDPQNIAKWMAAKSFCDNLGYDFRIINERDLTNLTGLC